MINFDLINFKFLRLWFKYSLSRYSRYKYIYKLIIDYKPKTILEIGVYKGIRSLEIIEIAKIFNKKIQFFGFDLFENISSKKIKIEYSKRPLSKKKIENKILEKFNNISLTLIAGNTIKTLKKFSLKKKKIDFIFIDGGHSIKTIRHDWNNVKRLLKKRSIVIFDDYYHDINISKKYGCKNNWRKYFNTRH